jgi:DUF4097 and DUF4098 domain-containing protein YvlB
MMKSLVSCVLIALCAVSVAVASDYRKVNGSVTVEAGQTVPSASTVNGSIRIGERAKVGEVDTVNGSIRLGVGATAGSLDTVNGSVDIDADARVEGDVETVNGKVLVNSGAVVAGNLENVNGTIEIGKAQIKGRIETITADLTLGADARVDGGILYRKPRMNWNAKQRVPRVVIGPGAAVGGSLIFEREVVLYVSETAKIGPVTGAKPLRFTGATPPG